MGSRPATGFAFDMGPPLAGALRSKETATAAPSGVGRCSRRSACQTSGDHPILDASLRLAEFVATLALAQDNAFGQPLEPQLRSCLLASRICEAAEFEQDVCDDA